MVQGSPPDELFSNPLQRDPAIFGLWDKSVKRPTTDRHFCPSASTSEDHKESFLSCPPSVCADSKMRKHLESKPLVKSLPRGKKILELPDPVFTKKPVSFKETPLSTVTQLQAKLPLSQTFSEARGKLQHMSADAVPVAIHTPL